MATPSPADSATVVVMRDLADAVEVLLVERHASSRAFAGAHVFPGGRVDPSDASPALRAASPALTAAAALERLGEPMPAESALAFWIAAIRELFEEAGLLLARRDGVLVSFADAAICARFAEHRAALVAGRSAFADIVVAERLELATDALHYLSRWITPVNAPRRYDARFFVAHVPAGQEPLHDDRETISTVWLTPRDALARADAGSMVLTPPTVRTLDELATLATAPQIVAAADARVVMPILPKPVQIDGRVAILYPGDAEYDGALPGSNLVETGSGCRNRVVKGERGWRTIRNDD